MVSLPEPGLPNVSWTIVKNIQDFFLLTLSSSQGTKKSLLNGPKTLQTPIRNPEGQTPKRSIFPKRTPSPMEPDSHLSCSRASSSRSGYFRIKKYQPDRRPKMLVTMIQTKENKNGNIIGNIVAVDCPFHLRSSRPYSFHFCFLLGWWASSHMRKLRAG
jgi:hypothetical protein